MTVTSEAKCKDCNNLKYFYKGKRKFHFCIALNTRQTLNDSAGLCINSGAFSFSVSAFPEQMTFKESEKMDF